MPKRPGPSTPWTTIEITTASEKSGVSLGLILPIVLIGVFLLIVATCLYWHSWRDKRRMRGNVGARSTFSISRLSSNLTSGNEWTKEYRSSTRSNTPLRTSFKERARIQQLDWSNPSDGDAVRPQYIQNMLQCAAMGAIDNPAFQPPVKRLSPIDETEASKHMSSASHAQSFAANLAPQAPFSPYHMTWVSGNEQNWERSSSLPNFSSLKEPRPYKHATQDSANSPYFPNNNTPTTPVHDASFNSTPRYGKTPGVINGACDVHDAPRSNRKPGRDEGSSATVYPESGNPSSNSAAVPLQRTRSGPSDLSEDEIVSSSLSLPSSISQWHQRNVVDKDWNNGKFGVVDVGGGIQNPGLASSIDSYTSSDNVSMHPNFGSSNNTSGLPRPPHTSGMTSVSTNNSGYRRVPNNTAASSAVLQNTIYRSEEVSDGTSSISNVNRSECLIHCTKNELPLDKQGSKSLLRRSVSNSAQKNCTPSPTDGDVVVRQNTSVNRSRAVSYPLHSSQSDGGNNGLTQPTYLHHITAPNLPPLLRHKQYWV